MISNGINWDEIFNVLQNEHFFDNLNNIPIERDQLQKSFENETSWDLKTFRKDICKAYYAKNDKQYIFYKILYKNGCINLTKRHSFYHIILHSYLNINKLNTKNIIYILSTIINLFLNDTKISKKLIEQIVNNKKEKFNGKTLNNLINQTNCSLLQKQFIELDIDTHIWQNVHDYMRNSWHKSILKTIKYQSEENKSDHSDHSETFLIHKSLRNTYLELKDVSTDDIIYYQIQSICNNPPQVNDHEISKQNTANIDKEMVDKLVKESTNSWLFLNDYNNENNDINKKQSQIADMCIGILVIVFQILAYFTLVYYLVDQYLVFKSDRRDNCYGPNCNAEQSACILLTSGGVCSFLLVGFLWGDVVNTSIILYNSCRSRKYEWILSSVLILIELLSAIASGYIVALYSESDFDAINGAVGILFVHDLDEKVFASMEVTEGSKTHVSKRKFFILFLWITISISVALGVGCRFQNGGYFQKNDCKIGEFKCGNGECIWEGFVCNGVNDCNEGADEKQNCDFSLINCPDDKLKCINTGKCIDIDLECDGILHCTDGSDEGRQRNCTDIILEKQCDESYPHIDWKYSDNSTSHLIQYSGYYKCNNGQCINAKYLCDGIPNDCVDGSDEYPFFYKPNDWPFLKQCPYYQLVECDIDEVLCKVNGQCISMARVCDQFEDCPDGQDEHLCQHTARYKCTLQVLRGEKFKCGYSIAKINETTVVFFNGTIIDYTPGVTDILPYIKEDKGRCILSEYRCDGIIDCDDGSDESFCTLFECKDNEYQCQITGDCIPKYWMCDFMKDCPFYDDENDTICIEHDQKVEWELLPENEIKCGDYKIDTITKHIVGRHFYFYYSCDMQNNTLITFSTCSNITRMDTVLYLRWTDRNNWNVLTNTYIVGDNGYEVGEPCKYNAFASTAKLDDSIQALMKCNEYYWIAVAGFYLKETFGDFTLSMVC